MAEKNVNKEAAPELVPYFLSISEKNSDDVQVLLNGMRYTVKRGVKVMVPRGVAEILDNMQECDNQALQRKLAMQGIKEM